MYNDPNWNLAVVRFAAFCSDIPLAPNEDDISEYHNIVRLFEESCGQDLSRFRIAPNRMSKVRNEAVNSVRGRWQTRRLIPLVEYRYFRGQVRGLVDFLMTVLNSRVC